MLICFALFADESIPTTAVGVVNTVRGHCAKTLSILNLALERFRASPNLKWLVLADDDTLLRWLQYSHTWDCMLFEFEL